MFPSARCDRSPVAGADCGLAGRNPEWRPQCPLETGLLADEGLKSRVADAVRDVTKLRGEVHLVAQGSLANDGKVIEDARSYQ